MSETADLVPTNEIIDNVPILPLRTVVYPHILRSLNVSLEILDAFKHSDNQSKVVLLAHKHATDEIENANDFYHVGTFAKLYKKPEAFEWSTFLGNTMPVVEGIQRCLVTNITKQNKGYYTAQVNLLKVSETIAFSKQVDILVGTVLEQFEEYIELTVEKNLVVEKNVIVERYLNVLDNLKHFQDQDPGRLCDTIAMYLSITLEEKQALLESFTIETRLKSLLSLLEKKLSFLNAKKQLRNRVKSQVEREQHQHFLRVQHKAIEEELGVSQEASQENSALLKDIKAAKMPKSIEEKALGEFNKLKSMAPLTAEASVHRTYLKTLVDVPWHQHTKARYDLTQARKVLDKAHQGLDKVKDRIIEFLAVQKKVTKFKGPILCLVGPPGIGKTSLGKSIAEATGRIFTKVSLGGVRDEAEIRGHRRTYIGSMPGQIMQKIIKTKVKNPVFMLDEIDKMGMDFRGDPASALLEVLDPEQNSIFNDHYLEVDYDLSDVFFIATANTLDIPEALRDRLEIIRLSSYTENEKVSIAQKHLLPKQKVQHGLTLDELQVNRSALLDIIRYYTSESGVRALERNLATLCRKVVLAIQINSHKKIAITSRNLESYLGVRQFKHGVADKEDQIGHVTGLAWTSVGGELLAIESVIMPGKGKINCTGHLGEVMQESAQAALTVVRSLANQFGINEGFYENTDFHIHVLEGATPKEGPSAGIAICTALFSSLLQRPVRSDLAMTGEISLSGKVLAIGGLQEKLSAAQRGRIRLVLIPKDNQKDLKEIPKNILHDLDIRPVSHIEEVLQLAFRMPIKRMNNIKPTIEDHIH